MDCITMARSNYFKVKDPAAFKAFCDRMNCELIQDRDNPDLYGFVCEGGIPSYVWDEEADDEVDVDFVNELAKQLAPGAVAIYMEVGYEGHRSVGGIAVAVNSEGQTRNVDLCAIYELAEELTDGEITPCEY